MHRSPSAPPVATAPRRVRLGKAAGRIIGHGCRCAPLVVSLPPRPAAPGNHSKSHLWSSGIFLILRPLACWHRAVSHHGSMRTWIDPGGCSGERSRGTDPRPLRNDTPCGRGVWRLEQRRSDFRSARKERENPASLGCQTWRDKRREDFLTEGSARVRGGNFP